MPPRRRPDRVKKLHKPSKEERAGRRSHGGFLLAAAAVVGGVAASIWRVVARPLPSFAAAPHDARADARATHAQGLPGS